jgi:putative transcriptional regulator
MNTDSDLLPGSGISTVAALEAEVPRLIRRLRTRMGLTQEKFAARVGVTFPTINRWENGRAKPSPLALKQIQMLLGELDNGPKLLEPCFRNLSPE